MKNNKHVESFGQFNENLNISDVSDSKEEIYNFLIWLRKNHKYRQFEVSGELRFQDVLSDKKYSFDEIYDFYKYEN